MTPLSIALSTAEVSNRGVVPRQCALWMGRGVMLDTECQSGLREKDGLRVGREKMREVSRD